ncbi:hypothetical protein Poli38472_001192 [Pythium oligandrum]|uniref:Uncharacterized protein n=1 Tax=Pythium oligandrum TaxID=41045 RepID=A0A8K1CSI2_PYTOL|nr:hypothetical protein Poli38472_001192 [Pythium oligandrum]|eukprot:TMW69036.1 hypothetical protein Poli38472_001192 [Pythium oligandrum]
MQLSSRLLLSLTTNRIVLDLAPWAYTLFHLCVIAVQAACIAYLVFMGRVYYFIEHPYMEYYADLLAPSDNRHLKFFGGAFYVIAGLHSLHVLWILIDEVRRLVRAKAGCRAVCGVAPSAPVHIDAPTESATQPHPSSLSQKSYGRKSQGILYDARVSLFSREGIFGVESPYFRVLFLAREIVEIGAQSFQVYRSSRLIARPWINDVSIAILVINCWSTPLWQLIFRHNAAMERIVCVISDGFLNMGTSILLPLIIFLPYVLVFDTEEYAFPLEMLYGDTEFTTFVMENQSILATSMVDGLSKIVSHCAILMSFPAMRSLVRCAAPANRTGSASSPVKGGSTQPGDKYRPSDHSFQTNMTTKPTAPVSKMSVGFHLAHGIFLAIGVAVLSLHIHASHTVGNMATSTGCLQTMRPWFASKHPCAIYRVDCHAEGISSPSNGTFGELDVDVLLNIFFMNCPQLQVPTSIQQFPNLIGVEVHNSTITQWSIDAAIHSDHHPRMMYLIMVRVNMTGLPDGVLQPLPPLLSDIELIHTNLTALPEDLDARWPNMALFFVEYGQIREFPSVLLRMPIFELSLVGNRIQELPPLQAEYSIFSMARNPLKSVADSVDDAVHIGYFSLQDTQVETLPDWIGTQVDVVVYLMDTPFCRALEERDVEVEQWRGDSVIACDKPDPRGSGRYPLELVDAMRQKQT